MALLTERREFPAEALGLPAHSVFRCPVALPDGRVAVGSDYGLILMDGDKATPFPFPAGARRECKDIQSMAFADGELHVVSAKNAYRWDTQSDVRSRSFPLDGLGGFEELRCVFAGPAGLIEAWRTRLVYQETTEKADDILCFARNADTVFFGTRSGRVGVLQGGDIARFDGEPVRHLAWAHNQLWVASNGALHSYADGSLTKHSSPEPFGLATDHQGRLWALDARGLSVSTGGEAPVRLSEALLQPWDLGCTPGHLWVGRRGGLVRWSL